MLEDDSECLRASSTPSLASLPVHKNRKTGVHFGIYREKTVPEYLVPKKPRVNLHHSRIVILTIMASGIILVICLTLLDFTMTQTRSVPVIHYARYRLEKTSNQNSQDSKPRRHNSTQADPKSDLLLYSSPLSIRKSNSSGCFHCGSENVESLADVKQISSVSRSKRIPFVSSETDSVSDEFRAVDFQSQKLRGHEDESITEDKTHHSNGNVEGLLKRKEKSSVFNDTGRKLSSDSIDSTQKIEEGKQVVAETEGPDISKTDFYTHENTEEFSTSSTDSWTGQTSSQSEKELSKAFESSTESWTEKIPFEDEEFRMGSEEGDPSHNLHYVYVEPKKTEYVTPVPENQNPEPETRTTTAPENHRRFPARPRSRPAKLYSKRKSPNSRSNGARALPQIQILEGDSLQQPQKLELISPQVTLERGGVFADDSLPDPNPASKSESRPMERRISFADFEEYPQLSNYKNLDHVKSVMDIIQYLNTESPFEGTSKDKLASNSGSRRKERHRQRTNARAETQNEPTDDPYTAVETVEKELTYPPDFGDTRPVDNFVPLRKRVGSKRYDFDAAKNQESNDYLTSDLGDFHSPVIPDDPEPSKILDSRAQTSVPDFIEVGHADHANSTPEDIKSDQIHLPDSFEQSKDGLEHRSNPFPIDKINSEFDGNRYQDNADGVAEGKDSSKQRGQSVRQANPKKWNQELRFDTPSKNSGSTAGISDPTLFLPNFYGSDTASYYAMNPSSFLYDAVTEDHSERREQRNPAAGFGNYNDLYTAFKPSDVSEINNLMPAAMLDEDYPPPPARPSLADSPDPYLKAPPMILDYIPRLSPSTVHTSEISRKFGSVGVPDVNSTRVKAEITGLDVSGAHANDQILRVAEGAATSGQGTQAAINVFPQSSNNIPDDEMKDHLVPPLPDEKSIYYQEQTALLPWDSNFPTSSIRKHDYREQQQPHDPLISTNQSVYNNQGRETRHQMDIGGRPPAQQQVQKENQELSTSPSHTHTRTHVRTRVRSKKRNRIRYQNPSHPPAQPLPPYHQHQPPTALAMTNATQDTQDADSIRQSDVEQ